MLLLLQACFQGGSRQQEPTSIPISESKSKSSFIDTLFSINEDSPAKTLQGLRNKECRKTLRDIVNTRGYSLHQPYPLFISFKVNPENDQGIPQERVIEAFTSAAKQWETDSVKFLYEGRTTTRDLAYDGENVFFFPEKWSGEDYSVAITHVYDKKGVIVGFDTALNPDFRHLPSIFDAYPLEGAHFLVNTATHELGHALGFGHSDDEHSTMYSSVSTGDMRKASLTQGDQADLWCKYPPPLPPEFFL